MQAISQLVQRLSNGNYRALARAISFVENESLNYEQLLATLYFPIQIPIIGITGPPGAGKSTLVNALIGHYLNKQKKIAIIAIDPSSPFNYGALLGDRIRLAEYYNNPNVFIRSLATRGSLGGLSDKIIEITDVVKAANFDVIFIETVGVGQSEVEIAALADTTVVALVPEAGDEIQTMKAGLMEIADVFVVNKSDRPASSRFIQNLRKLVHSKPLSDWNIPVIPTIATQKEGIAELAEKIEAHQQINKSQQKKLALLTRKALQIIQKERMKSLDVEALKQMIAERMETEEFNLYKIAKKWTDS